MFFKRKRKVILSNSTLAALSTAEKIMDFLWNGNPYRIVHSSIFLDEYAPNDLCDVRVQIHTGNEKKTINAILVFKIRTISNEAPWIPANYRVQVQTGGLAFQLNWEAPELNGVLWQDEKTYFERFKFANEESKIKFEQAFGKK